MGSALEARVLAALAAIRNPRLENDLLSAGMIRNLAVTGSAELALKIAFPWSQPRLSSSGPVPEPSKSEYQLEGTGSEGNVPPARL